MIFPVPLNTNSAVWTTFENAAILPAPLPSANPTKSFWLDSDPSANPLAKAGSTGPLPDAADVVIIGSGITGCSAAYHLANLVKSSGGEIKSVSAALERQASNHTLFGAELHRPRSTRLGRNGGHLTPVSIHDFRDRVKLHGKDEALRDVELERYTVSSILNFLEKTPNAADEVDLVRGGHVTLLFSPEEVEAARADMSAAAEAGLDLTGVDWLEPDVTLDRFRVRLPGVFGPGHTIWPLKLVTKLFEDAKGTKAPDTWIGKASALFSRTAPPAFSLDLFTQAPVDAVGETPSPKIGRKSAGERMKDMSIGKFARPPANEEDRALVILGGGRETAVPHHEFNVADDSTIHPVISATLRGFLPTLFPHDFEAGEPEMEWTGIMGFTHNSNPMVGPVRRDDGQVLAGQYIAAGYSGHGMPRAFACAEIVAQMVHAEMLGKPWAAPKWFPRHLLTKPLDDTRGT
ncbi:FAD-dependent oxidoreductase [Ceratobasidium sp. AG-Ba]|nr:FAD-dependent oxidoreductase [Ceratobasidium sp. AG-Ba]